MASLIFKNIKFGQDCFLKLLLSLLSKCHFLTGHCVRRVKVKVASKGLVKTLIPSSEISCKTILPCLYRHIKAFTHPPDNKNLNLFLIICILNGKKEEEIWLLGLSMPYKQHQQMKCCPFTFQDFVFLNLNVRDENEKFVL